MGNPTTPDWVRLEVLILRRACTILRKLFKKRWNSSQKKEWTEGPDSGLLFISSLGRELHQSCGRLHKMTLEEGDSSAWDFSLLSRILQQVRFQPEIEIQAEQKRVDDLISSCKAALDHPQKAMEDPTFSKLWDEIEQLLVSFGESEKELEELKRSESVSEDDLLSISDKGKENEIDEASLAEARKLKELAKEMLQEGNSEKAINLLSEAIAVHHFSLPDLELGALFSARSDAFLKKAGKLSAGEERKSVAYMALKDAKQALYLRPAWALAHYRLGTAYVELGKYKKASKYLDQALSLEPNMEEIQVANSSCKVKLVQLSENFGKDLPTFENLHSPKPLPGGTRLSPLISPKIDSIFFPEDEDNILSTIYHAHKLRDGVDSKQSYKDAAALYRKGVRSRNAEAMYNLALFKLEGLGVKQDVKGALDLLKRAAKQPSRTCPKGYNYVSNVGVAEASFLLGLLAEKGIGLPPQKDPFSASVYYSAASELGHGPAAHNLALLCSRGLGTLKNEKRALSLWKLAAARKVPEAMFSLAIHAARDWEVQEARRWFELAMGEWEAENGCLVHGKNDLVTDLDLDKDQGQEGEKWTPTPTLVSEFYAVLSTIEYWRMKYGMKEVARWELSAGLGKGSQNLPIRTRVARLLEEREEERERLAAVQEYFKDLRSRPVSIPLNKAAAWAQGARHEIFMGPQGSEGESRPSSQSRSISSASTESVGSV